ncbi:DUF3813 domain-containing protein [Bacillus sp. FJAT-42376]|uniref:DUF3813 domain-containing protein n=1 Tax=Bacillus sp. FJAT-42376 TaxID=2014076 RepID=UPI000F4DEE4A|nr:DUF3813 domain-containing protein [Bacillus sp. FJAT-42376]AZB42337.1 DUF3813 domain-containing protein [Bacillus sp. FJAT-42376]
MGNKLFQKARETVNEAAPQDQASMDRAKNALSSAFSNSTDAEKAQLQELQQKLENR